MKTSGKILSLSALLALAVFTSDDVPIRFTINQENLYAILLERPEGTSITIVNLKVEPDAEISLLGTEGELLWKQNGENLDVNLPESYPDSEAYVLSITRGLQRKSDQKTLQTG